MPRLARLDIAGLLQHVIVRGIERRDIFIDDIDRQNFVDRVTTLLPGTGVRCYAWAILSYHFHMLLMPTATPLGSFMRRLLTGYAVSFNRRHNRCGHLFQNRYKSIVCEEEPYLLELIRYIHLNPLRAGMVASLEELDPYRWSGHAVLMGNRSFSGQETNSILERFGNTHSTAQQNYRQFVSEGIKKGRREELVGGGLKRSQAKRKDNECESFDERILGGGDFVDELKLHVELQTKMQSTVTLARLLEVVSGLWGLDPESVRRPSKTRAPAAARGIICHLAIFECGYRGSEVGRFLHLGSSGVSLAAKRGEKILRADPAMLKQVMAKIEK
jgi:REP element-mobilizing transposase RayT